MDIDLVMACAHHLVVFALVVLLAVEFALTRPGLAAPAIRRLAGIDAAYGGMALLVLIVGFARVSMGSAGSAYYFSNWVFWTKIGLFALIGLLSILPTLRYRAWARAAKADLAFSPDAGAVRSVRRLLHAELGLLFLIPLLAAAMARGYGV